MKERGLEKLLTGLIGKIKQIGHYSILWLRDMLLRSITWFKMLIRNNSSESRATCPILNELKQTAHDSYWAHNCFNNTTDKRILDYAIYQMLAAEARYSYLLTLKRIEHSSKALNK